jgi:hypothetical protein
VVSARVRLNAGEVTVETQPGKVKGEQLVEAVNRAEDGSHTFKAKLKQSPEKK